MDQFEALIGVGQLGIALSGFAGVVFALSGREAIALPENRGRLRALLENGLAACFLSLIPQILWGLMSAQIVWALSSAAYLLYASVGMGRSLLQMWRDMVADPTLSERVPLRLTIFTSVGAVLVMMLQVGNIASWQSFNAFFLGVVFLLLIAALMFIQLLATKLAAQQSVAADKLDSGAN